MKRLKRIKKVGKLILNNKYVKWVIIPLLLIVFWFAFSLLFNNRMSFSVIEYNHTNPIIEKTTDGPLYKGEKILGEFEAKENYLGIVSIRFREFIKPDYRGEDVLEFKIREKGSGGWYYLNNYRSGSLENQLLYPFGFPIINDSKGKFYEFEITSLYGNSTNAVDISDGKSILKTAYNFPRHEIAGSKKLLLGFLYKKSLASISDIDFLLSSSIFLIPLVLYFLLHLFTKLSIGKFIFIHSVLILITLNIFLIPEVHIGILLSLLLGWLVSIKAYKLDNNISFLLGFLLIILWLLLNLINIITYTNKLNIWAFIFLAIGSFQLLLEEKGIYKSRTNYRKFFNVSNWKK